MATSYQPKYFETLDGVRYAKKGLRLSEACVLGALGSILYERVDRRGKAGFEWEFSVGDGDGTDTILQPNLCFVSRERMERLDDIQRQSPPFSPDIAIEVRALDSDADLRDRKTQRYLATGAVLVLDVDPAERVIIAHSRGGTRTYAISDQFEHVAAPWLVFAACEAFVDLDY